MPERKRKIPKNAERKLLWGCTAWACLKVESEGTGKRQKFIFSDEKGEVRCTSKEFQAFKKAIQDGKL